LNLTTSQLPRRERDNVKVSVQINPHQATTSFKVAFLPSASAFSLIVECTSSEVVSPDALKKVPAVRAGFISAASSFSATLQRNAVRRVVSSTSTRGDIHVSVNFSINREQRTGGGFQRRSVLFYCDGDLDLLRRAAGALQFIISI
jgi:hypothetical protein